MNILINGPGIFSKSYESYFEICKDIGVEQRHLNYTKVTFYTIHYYFCCMPLSNPDFSVFQFFISRLLVIVSQSYKKHPFVRHSNEDYEIMKLEKKIYLLILPIRSFSQKLIKIG